MYSFPTFLVFYENIDAYSYTHVKNHQHHRNYHNLNYPILVGTRDLPTL
jgi:hypothetical protein